MRQRLFGWWLRYDAKVGKVTSWLFRTMFPGEYGHMSHLVDDVIRLERELAAERQKVQYTIVTGSNAITVLHSHEAKE